MKKITRNISVDPQVWKVFSKVVQAYKKLGKAKSNSDTLEQFMKQFIVEAVNKNVIGKE